MVTNRATAPPGAAEQQVPLARLQRILDGGNDGYWEWDVDTSTMFVSSRWRQIVGLPGGERTMTSQEIVDLVHPDDFGRLDGMLAAIASPAGGDRWELEHRFRSPDGPEVWVSVRGTVVERGPDGRARKASGLMTDITARKRSEARLLEMEASLRQSEEFNRGIIENSQDCIKVLDLEGRLLFMSVGGLRNLGLEDTEAILNSCFVGFFGPADQPRVAEAIALAREGRRGHFQAACPPEGPGSRFWDVIITPMLASDGRPHRLLAISRDVTESKAAEELRLEMERRLLYTQKLESLGLLAGGIAHDFNNLLLVVMGHLELAMAGIASESPARHHLQQVASATGRAADLTRQMLAYSGRGSFAIERLDLSSLAAESLSLLGAGLSRSTSLVSQLEADLPPVQADKAQLQQVLVNLVTNAAEALGDRPGVVTISTGARECDREMLAASCLHEKPAPGRFAWLEVADTGCGMDPDTRERLFDPFFTTKFPGRGLGMSVVLGVVRGHRGALLLETAPGQGTRVRVMLPVAPAVVAESGQGRSSPGREIHRAGVGRRGTILVVDDEMAVLHLCSSVLVRSGFAVLTATGGQEAIQLFRDHADEISAVILDLTMPALDGLAAFDELRAIRPDVKVILCSGYSERDATRAFAGRPLAGFMQKPYQLSALGSEVERVLNLV
jgi:PAS domain S-box-containing protein